MDAIKKERTNSGNRDAGSIFLELNLEQTNNSDRIYRYRILIQLQKKLQNTDFSNAEKIFLGYVTKGMEILTAIRDSEDHNKPIIIINSGLEFHF